MSGVPKPDTRAMMILKGFALCETFGWTLEDLGVPEDERDIWIEGFLTIIRHRNEENERESKVAELKNKFGR